MKREDKGRLLALEGLRGIAAIMVAVYHAVALFWCSAIFGLEPNRGVQHMRFEDNLFANPISVLYSGTFAVAIFFVLSGFVLSIGYFKTRDVDVIKKLAAKRYIRLMVPALASVMLAWLLLTLGLSSNSEALAMTRSAWLEMQWNFLPNFFDALYQGAVGIFVSGQVYYNPVLWTMMYEFIGSFIVFSLLLVFGKSKNLWVLYIPMILLFFGTWFMPFILGMGLAHIYSKGLFPFNNPSLKFTIPTLFLGMFFGGYPILKPTVTSVYNTLTIPALSAAQNVAIYTSIGAALVIIGVLSTPAISKFFSRKWISALGKYTFSLYLVHKLVLFTFTVAVFVWLSSFMGYNWAAVTAISISIPLIGVCSYLFEKYIDAPAIKLSSIFSRWMLSGHAGKEPDK